MVKLVYTQDLKSCGLNNHGGSIPSGGTQLNFTGLAPIEALAEHRGLAQLASAHGLGP